MAKHTASTGHDSGKQEGGKNSGSSGGKAVLKTVTGETIGSVGPDKGHTER